MQIITQGHLSRHDSNAIRKVFVSPEWVEGFSKCSAVINFLFIGAASLDQKGLSALQNAAGMGKWFLKAILSLICCLFLRRTSVLVSNLPQWRLA